MANLADPNDPIYIQNVNWLRPGETPEAWNTRIGYDPNTGNITPRDIGIVPQETPAERELREAEEAQFRTSQTAWESGEETRQAAIRQLQGEVDALDRIYAQKRADITAQYEQKGVKRVGSQAALLAGAGMLGQVSGEAERAGLDSSNLAETTAAQNVVDEERNNAVAALRGEIRSMTAKNEADRILALQSSAADFVAYKKLAKEREQEKLSTTVKNALLKKIDLSNPKDATVIQIAKDLGISADSLANYYKEQKTSYDAEEATAKSKAEKEALELAKLRGDISKPIEVGGFIYTPDGQGGYVKSGVKYTASGSDSSSEGSTHRAELATQGRNAVSNLLSIAESNPEIFGRSAAMPIPDWMRSDPYRDYKAQIDYLKGNIIPSALGAMRDASKTGGALGQVSDREGAWLAASLGALDMSQSPDAVIKSLKEIDASLKRWQDAVNSSNMNTSSTSGMLRIKDPTSGEIREHPDTPEVRAAAKEGNYIILN